MKKSLLAIVVGALAVASTANAGLYAEGDLGLSRTKLSNGGSSKTKIEPRVAVGYKLGNVRVAGDYTHHGNFQGTKVQGLGATVFYDFDTNSQIEPYVGARLAANRSNLKNVRINAIKALLKPKWVMVWSRVLNIN